MYSRCAVSIYVTPVWSCTDCTDHVPSCSIASHRVTGWSCWAPRRSMTNCKRRSQKPSSSPWVEREISATFGWMFILWWKDILYRHKCLNMIHYIILYTPMHPYIIYVYYRVLTFKTYYVVAPPLVLLLRLRQAGVRVWVLTGDKVDTAISIAMSCKLLTEEMNNFIIDNSTEQRLEPHFWWWHPWL